MQKVIFIILFIIVTLTSNAQLSVGYRYGIGTHGVNFEPDYKWHVGYTRSSHGLIFTYVNAGNAGLQLEVNYAQKGWKEVIDTIPGDYYQRNLDYIEIPFYSHFEIGHKMLRPVVILGPYLGFQINDSYERQGFDDRFEQPIYKDYPYHQETRKLDFGIKVGAGLRLNVNKRLAIFGEVHYDVEMVGSRDIFIDRPAKISVSRLQETSGVFGIMWHIVPQKEQKVGEGYTPKEDIYLNNF